MRLIYTDEAGTSAGEPVCVVAGVIVHADLELRLIEQELHRVISEGVPAQYRKNFVFHATEVFSGGKNFDRDVWPREDRLEFLKHVLCLPYVHDLPIFVGKVVKSSYEEKISTQIKDYYESILAEADTKGNKKALEQKLRSFKTNKNAMAHVVAFQLAMERADYFLRKNLNGSEVGAVYAEDIPEMRETLKLMGLSMRDESRHLVLPQRPADDAMPDAPVDFVRYKIDHIVEQPCFVPKGVSPMLQLADACAFGFRHYFAGKAHGQDMLFAMVGPNQANAVIADDRWLSGWSNGLFNSSIQKPLVYS